MADESGKLKASTRPSRTIVTKIGIPEVDRIVEGNIFKRREQNGYTRTAAPPEANDKMEDRISRLPDDVLKFIISLLSMKEGGVTSILSRRWENLWNTFAPFLDFSMSNMIARRYLKDDKKSYKNKATRNEFIRRVDRLLKLHLVSRLDAIRLSFSFNKAPESDVDRWLESAATKGVSQLELYFSVSRITYKFPIEIFAQQLRYLSLRCCIFNFPPDFSGFNSLISLKLEEIELTECVVQNILTNCSSLKKLDLISCDFPDNSCLQFRGPSLILKHISCLGCEGVKEITVSDMNILSFELKFEWYDGAKLSIKNAPHLTRLALDMYCPNNITCDFPHLEILYMSSWSRETIFPKKCDFSKLKQLVVLATREKINFLEMVDLLEATPLLQRFELDMGTSVEIDENLESIKTRSTTANSNLKEVELYGFEGVPIKIEFAKYLLKIAIVLVRMKIFIERKIYRGNGLWRLRDRQTKKQGGKSLEDVSEFLRREMKPPTELIIGSQAA